MTVCWGGISVATPFKDMTYTVEVLVREIERGDIALPGNPAAVCLECRESP
jgi:hypothetical protein